MMDAVKFIKAIPIRALTANGNSGLRRCRTQKVLIACEESQEVCKAFRAGAATDEEGNG